MTEPTYIFKKGEGWIPRISPYVLTAADCLGDWFTLKHEYDTYGYPTICKDWTWTYCINSLQVGDIVPYDDYVKIIYKVVNGKAYHHTAIKEGRNGPLFYPEVNYLLANENWYGVMRQ